MLLQRLYIGLNDKDTHEQIISTESAKEIIKNILAGRYTSYTIIEGEGVFLKESEKNIIIEYICTSEELMISPDYVSRISRMLNQLVALETIQEIRYNFI